jgi:hypothetical protein
MLKIDIAIANMKAIIKSEKNTSEYVWRFIYDMRVLSSTKNWGWNSFKILLQCHFFVKFSKVLNSPLLI